MKHRIRFNKGLENYGYDMGAIDEFNLAPKDADEIIEIDDSLSPEEQQKIIDKAIIGFDKKADEATSKTISAQLKEQDAIENDPDVKPYLYIAGMSAKQIAHRYRSEDIKKYAKSLGLKVSGKEEVVAQRILDHHNS